MYNEGDVQNGNNMDKKHGTKTLPKMWMPLIQKLEPKSSRINIK